MSAQRTMTGALERLLTARLADVGPEDVRVAGLSVYAGESLVFDCPDAATRDGAADMLARMLEARDEVAA